VSDEAVKYENPFLSCESYNDFVGADFYQPQLSKIRYLGSKSAEHFLHVRGIQAKL